MHYCQMNRRCDIMIYIYPQQCRNIKCKANYVIPSVTTRCKAQLIVRQYFWQYDTCQRCIDSERMEKKFREMPEPPSGTLVMDPKEIQKML